VLHEELHEVLQEQGAVQQSCGVLQQRALDEPQEMSGVPEMNEEQGEQEMSVKRGLDESLLCGAAQQQG